MATQKHGKMDDAKKEKAKAKLEDLKIILMDPNFINFYYVIKNQDIKTLLLPKLKSKTPSPWKSIALIPKMDSSSIPLQNLPMLSLTT